MTEWLLDLQKNEMDNLAYMLRKVSIEKNLLHLSAAQHKQILCKNKIQMMLSIKVAVFLLKLAWLQFQIYLLMV